MAYTSLIEEPTPSTSLMSHIAQESGAVMKSTTIPKPARMTQGQFHSLQHPHLKTRGFAEPTHEEVTFSSNILPLPPRTTKPKLVDKPRHFRKYPLKLVADPKPQKEAEKMEESLPIIYQNTKSSEKKEEKAADEAIANEDVVDSAPKVDTNPFNNVEENATANPFDDFFMVDTAKEDIGVQVNVESSDSSDAESNMALVRALVKERKDHVSVEDLLEFADQKPCGRQRGEESDEVRIMTKVLKEQANQAQCLEALELSGWNVHNAIKLVRVKVSVGTDVTFDKCHEQLQKTNGDIVKAVSMLVSIDHT